MRECFSTRTTKFNNQSHVTRRKYKRAFNEYTPFETCDEVCMHELEDFLAEYESTG